MPLSLQRWTGLFLGAAGIVAIVWLDARFGHHAQHQLNHLTYSLALLTGFMTSFHCTGMCGALVLSYITKNTARGRPAYASHLWYALGKTLSYTVIGAAFATLGAVVAFTPWLRGVIGTAAGIFLILFGLSMLGVFPLRMQLRTPPFVMRFIGRQYKQYTHPFVIGLLNGLMIVCGPLQAMYVLAAGSGDPWQGAALLFCFGIGTLPLMLGFGLCASTIAKNLGAKLVKFSSVVVTVLGAVMLNRGLALAATGYDLSSLIARLNATDGQAVRTIHMQIGPEDFLPDHMLLRTGEAVHWEIEVTPESFCRTALEIPAYHIHMTLRSGLQTIDITPPRQGLVLWRCATPERYGAFTVQ